MVSDKPKIFSVVEDRKTLALLQAVLQPNGYEVIQAANGSEVLEALKRGLGELVILDDQVSKMNCYEVCQKIKEGPSTKDIPVLLLSSRRIKAARVKGLEAGATDFLTKPIDSVELLVRTKGLIKRKELEDLVVPSLSR